MSPPPNSDGAPRSFREVAIVINGIRDDINDVRGEIEKLNQQQQKFFNRVYGVFIAFVCPLAVGVILGYVYK